MPERSVAIMGAGTMGAGIAQVAVQHGWMAHLVDVDVETVRDAIRGITARFDRLVEKERMTPSERDGAVGRLIVASGAERPGDCDLLIEAIAEDLDLKVEALAPWIDDIHADCIIATNTSSLSISELGARLGQAHRVVGMHFFNPAPLMKLVEVIAGRETDPSIVERVTVIAREWGKEVALAADVPGFIVNHVARPFYLEAFRILEDGLATAQDIDIAMKTLGGFKMGPLELTDLIGQDVNVATTRSVWEQLDRPPLLKPSDVQESLVEQGFMGRKTGRGVYDYRQEPPVPAIEINRHSIDWAPKLRDAVDGFVAAAVDRAGTQLQRYVFARILVALIAQAHHAQARGVAAADDIDIALRFGANYPRGPFQWSQQIGPARCAELMEALNEAVDDDRLAPPDSLRAAASSV